MNARLKRAIVRSAARLEAAIERERLDGGEPSRAAPEAEAARDLVARLAELDQRVADVQALTARIYERTFDWARELAAIRSAPDYEAAWDESEPLVSVRIATYDNPELLCERALVSLRAQTYERWEAIVVGDAVTDDTEARVRAIGDPRIRFVNLPHRGPYPEDEYRQWLVAGIPAMNRGTREANGRWIAPLDHDDEWDADHMEVLLAEARRSRAELAYGQLRVRDAATGRPLPSIVGSWPPEYSKFGLQGAIYHAGAFRLRDGHERALCRRAR